MRQIIEQILPLEVGNNYQRILTHLRVQFNLFFLSTQSIVHSFKADQFQCDAKVIPVPATFGCFYTIY